MDTSISFKETSVILDVMCEPIQLLHSVLNDLSRKHTSVSITIAEFEGIPYQIFFAAKLIEATKLTLRQKLDSSPSQGYPQTKGYLWLAGERLTKY